MKDYLASIALFFLGLLMLTNFALKEHKGFIQRQRQIEQARFDAQQTAQSLELKSLQLRAQLAGNSPETFVETYGESIRSMNEVSFIATAISQEGERFLIPIQEQRTESRLLPGRAGSSITEIEANVYSASILGSFRDSLRWLGRIEEIFPLARTEVVEITPSGDLLSLRVTMVFPKLDPKSLNVPK